MPIANPQPADTSGHSNQLSRWHAVIALVCLLLVEAACFGPGIRQIGFYLDDWSMFSQLHFCSQDFVPLLKQCLSDIRVQIRPLEAPYFVVLQLLFKGQPLGAHLVNCALEIAGAWFLYMGLARLTADRALSLVAALLFLLYPSHDATHYWITASSATLSMTLFTASFWTCLKSAQENRPAWLWLSAWLFAFSVFNYEAYMPLCAVTGLCLLVVYKPHYSWRQTLVKSALRVIPYLAVIASMWAYQRLYLASLKTSYTRPLTLDPQYMLAVIQHGYTVNLGTEGWSFFLNRTREALPGLPVNGHWLLWVIPAAALALFLLTDSQPHCRRWLVLLLLGLFTVFCSYTIFAVAADYVPTLQTTMSRINYGGALGAALLISGVLGFTSNLLKVQGKLRALTLSLLLCPLLTIFILANWGQARPWILSWNLQKHIRQILVKNHHRFQAGDTIILANAPRYVLWSPMFDGVWDFEPMLRMTLNNPQINGNVVSERLSVSATGIQDISMNFVCGKYPFKNMYVLVPAPEQWFEVQSAGDFIQTIESHGMGFGLSPEALKRWKKESIKITEAS